MDRHYIGRENGKPQFEYHQQSLSYIQSIFGNFEIGHDGHVVNDDLEKLTFVSKIGRFQRRLHRRHQPSTTVYPNHSHNAAWATLTLPNVLPKETKGCETMNIKLALGAGFAVAAYFLGIVADANHNFNTPLYPAACFLQNIPLPRQLFHLRTLLEKPLENSLAQ